MIKGDKRTFYPKVGSTCIQTSQKIGERKCTIIGYFKREPTLVLVKFLEYSSKTRNAIACQFVKRYPLCTQDLHSPIIISDETVRNDPALYGIVQPTSLKYQYSGKQIKISFKLPKLTKKDE